jgi:hypothetical protein
MRKLLRAAPAAALVLALVGGVASQAPAAPQLRPKVCNALAFLQIGGGPGAWTWDFVAGSGNCFGDTKGPYILTGQGHGTSTMLGLCDNLLVTNLNIAVQWTLISLLNGQTTTLNENWVAAISTFPVATPFLVRSPVKGNLLGAGAILTRFAGKCPPNDQPQSVIVELRLFA